MLYIKKREPSLSFLEANAKYKDILKENIKTRDIFEDFKRDAKLTYNGENKKYIVEEQRNLCAYCERVITVAHNDSHIEHIKPLSKYKTLSIEYDNLIVSCNGYECKQENCGHKKDDEILPLNPIDDIDISEYFEYNKNTGEIKSSSKDEQKAMQTIRILNLDSKRLRLARIDAKDLFEEKYFGNINETDSILDIFYDLGYVSYLNFYYNRSKN
jgi:uncharacterized protein (TIGR02646 family)